MYQPMRALPTTYPHAIGLVKLKMLYQPMKALLTTHPPVIGLDKLKDIVSANESSS